MKTEYENRGLVPLLIASISVATASKGRVALVRMQVADKKGVLVLFVGGRQEEKNLRGGCRALAGVTLQPALPAKQERGALSAAGAHGFHFLWNLP